MATNTMDIKAQMLKSEQRRLHVHQEIIKVDEETDIEFKDERAKERWNTWFENHEKTDLESKAFEYARRVAKYTQHLMKKHNITNDIKVFLMMASISTSICEDGIVDAKVCGRAYYILDFVWKYRQVLPTLLMC